MIHAVSPHPTTSFSNFFIPFELFAVPFKPPFSDFCASVAVSKSSLSRSRSSTHSALAFHTPAISSQLLRFGFDACAIRFQASSLDSSNRRCERMILMPSSFTHTTHFPLKLHLIVLMVPSPWCRTVSFPLLLPSPMLPSHPEADAAELFVFASELTPDLPPTVNIRLPARPPERYVRSVL